MDRVRTEIRALAETEEALVHRIARLLHILRPGGRLLATIRLASLEIPLADAVEWILMAASLGDASLLA